jgi:hypothetical protein
MPYAPVSPYAMVTIEYLLEDSRNTFEEIRQFNLLLRRTYLDHSRHIGQVCINEAMRLVTLFRENREMEARRIKQLEELVAASGDERVDDYIDLFEDMTAASDELPHLGLMQQLLKDLMELGEVRIVRLSYPD